MLSISTKFYPIRILAYMRNETELNITIANGDNDVYWIETDVILPTNVLSLAPDKELLQGRIRGGILFPNETRTVRCKIYANSAVYPDNYKIKIIAYAFDKEGTISQRKEMNTELRCERIR